MKLLRLPVLFQICVAHFISHFHMLVLPVLIPLISAMDKEMTFVKLGVAISVFNIVSAVVQLPMGMIVDKLGAKRVLIAGILIGSFGFISLGFIQSYTWLLIAMGIIGVANTIYHPADYAILSQNVPDNKMGRAFSLHTFSGMAGFAITPTIILYTVNVASIDMAYIVSGVMGILVAIVIYPDAKNELVKKVNILQVEFSNDEKQPINYKQLINITVIFMLVIFFFLNMSSIPIQNFSVSALINGYSMNTAQANVILTIFLIMSSIGVLAGGVLAERTKKHGFIAAIALIITGFLTLFLAFLPISSSILITLIMSIIGGLSGMIAPSRDMLVKAIAPEGAEGRVFGIVSTGFNIGSAVAPIVFGWILDHGYPRGVFGWTAVFMLITAIMVLLQERKGKN